jgi:hypothetical protein
MRICFAEANYNDYPPSQKSILFLENFDDNKNNWPMGTSNKNRGYYRIENGYYYAEATGGNTQIFWSNNIPAIDESRDFEIEAEMKYVSGTDNRGSSLVWGRSPENQYYAFQFSGNGYYRIDKHVNNKYEPFFSWKKSYLVKKFEFNKFTVRKIGNTCYFFLNETQVYSIPFEAFFGKQIGFTVVENGIIAINYLKISYLTKETPNLPPEILIAEPDMTRGTKTVSTKKLRVRGKAKDADGIYEVTVNGIEAKVESDGRFFADIPLKIGKNKISIKVTDIKMRSAHKEFSVTRETRVAVADKPVKKEVKKESKPASVSEKRVAVREKRPAVREKRPAVTEKRLALLIGNSTYEHGGNLPNPVNDVRALKKILEALNFEVLKHENSSQKQMKKAMDRFGKKLKNYSVGLFFYAGHGLQVKGNNYLVPVDAQLNEENDAEYDTVRADRVLAKMESAGSKTNIVILDSCRDNPFERGWRRGTRGRGLAFMTAPSGSIIAYATSPGNTASDGSGSNSPYTAAILKHIQTPNITIEQFFKRVRTSVMDESDNKQIPWESTSLRGEFYFKK